MRLPGAPIAHCRKNERLPQYTDGGISDRLAWRMESYPTQKGGNASNRCAKTMHK
jgi:hypothetical protein